MFEILGEVTNTTLHLWTKSSNTSSNAENEQNPAHPHPPIHTANTPVCTFLWGCNYPLPSNCACILLSLHHIAPPWHENPTLPALCFHWHVPLQCYIALSCQYILYCHVRSCPFTILHHLDMKTPLYQHYIFTDMFLCEVILHCHVKIYYTVMSELQYSFLCGYMVLEGGDAAFLFKLIKM